MIFVRGSGGLCVEVLEDLVDGPGNEDYRPLGGRVLLQNVPRSWGFNDASTQANDMAVGLVRNQVIENA